MKEIIRKLIQTQGGRYSRELGIHLSGGNSGEIFKWFLASKLFGARINSALAARTYKAFEKKGLLSPKKILNKKWAGLVRILDEGGYARYDFSTARRLLSIATNLEEEYGGDLNTLHERASDGVDLEIRLMRLGKGIGKVTTNIFLRELRQVWRKAQPEISPLVRLAAGNLGFLKKGEVPLQTLQKIWMANKMPGNDFCDFEAALVRLGKDYCKPLKCQRCDLKTNCKRLVNPGRFTPFC